MPYAAHCRVTFAGDWVGTPGEIWEFGISIVGGSAGYPNLETIAADLGEPLVTWYGSSSSGMTNAARLKTIKFANIAPDGSYHEPAEILDTSTQGGVTTPATAPGFVSLCMSFRTGQLRPPGAYGRCYPPNNSYPLADMFRVSTASTQANANAAGDLLHTITNTSSPGAYSPVVASKVAGANFLIIQASSDSLYDVQRRRKNQLTGVREISS